MFLRFALVAALLIVPGLVAGHSIATPAVTSQAAFLADAPPLPLFSTETAAQAHCPNDIVVWLNIPSGIYHYKGERWYGSKKHGAYACESEAIKAGDRASLNGQ